ncbi:MAG: insulinase family protein [Armatimonadetes bacterium]|nr:insulinase family protein [Armatimonadota bacterium]
MSRALVALLLALLLGGSARAESDLLELPGGLVERYRLPGGPTVLLQAFPDLPAATVAMVVATGSAADPPGKRGQAHLLEHLLYRATPDFPRGKLLVRYEQIGARSGAMTTHDHLVFWESVPRPQLELAVKAEAGRLKSLSADDRDLARERELVLGELRLRLNRPENRLERALDGRLRGAPSAEELARDLPSITLADLQQRYRDTVRRSNAVLVVVGGFAPRDVRRQLAALFPSEQEPPSPPAPGSAPPAEDASPVQLLGPPMVEFLYPLDGENYLPFSLLDAALEAPPGVRLFTQLDPIQGVYRIRVSPSPGQTVAETRSWLAHALHAVAKSGPDTIAAARNRALSNFYHRLEDPATRAVQLALHESRGSLGQLIDFPERLAQVAALSDQLLSPERAAQGHLDGEPGEARMEEQDQDQAGDRLIAAQTRKEEDVAAPRFVRHELENGVTVLIQTVAGLPTVTVRGYLEGGMLLDPPERPGLTYLAAGLLGTGTTHRKDAAFSKSLRELGLEMRFEPGRQAISVEGWMRRDQLAQWLELLSEALRNPAPSEESLARARVQNLRRLEQNSPEDRALEQYLQRIFPAGHPYGLPPAGDVRTSREASSAEVLAHLNRIARPDRLVLVFSGDVTESDVLRRLRPGLTSWYVDHTAPPMTVPPVTMPAASRLDLPSSGPYALVLIGHPGPARRDSDYYAFNLLNQILGGNPVSSRLARRIRDREKLGPLAESRLLSTVGPVPWAVVLKVQPDKVDQALAVVREELEALRKQAPTDAEIRQAVQGLEGRLQVSQGTAAGRADLLRNLEFHRLSDSYPDAFAGLYRHIRAADLLAVARRRLHPGNLVVVVCGPGGESPSTGPKQ